MGGRPEFIGGREGAKADSFFTGSNQVLST